MRKMNPGSIKAIAIDLDGTTLLPNTTLGGYTRQVFKKLLSRGMQIIIATGRAIEAAEKFRSAIGTEGPMVFFNGAEVADVPSGKVLYTNMIGLDVADFGTDIAREMGVYFQVYLPPGISPDTGMEDPKRKSEALLTDMDCEEAAIYTKHTGIVPIIKDLKSLTKLPVSGCIKGMYIADPSLHGEIRRRMSERFGEHISVMRSFPTFLEILNAGVSKGEGLKIAMRHRGLKSEEVIAFGDEENDLPMFPVAGFAGAPENARENIREQADFIYGSIAEEGLAAYLEKTFL